MADTTCGGYKKVKPVEENQDPLLAIAKRYLSIPCSVMSPNDGRIALLDELIRSSAWMEWWISPGMPVIPTTSNRIPSAPLFAIGTCCRFFHLETDYSTPDTEQLRVKLEAFFELML